MGRLGGKPFGWREETRIHDFLTGQDHDTDRSGTDREMKTQSRDRSGTYIEGTPVGTVVGKTAVGNKVGKSGGNAVEICGREIVPMR